VISYAQNAEDVVLARALRGSTGLYVDVGAGHPEIASVTKHFYDLGWRGINIEPRSEAIALLNEQRPRDINLQVAAGASNGTIELYLVDADPDLSTTDRDGLELLRDRGYELEVETVPVRTLDSILEEYGVTATSFLKIDVEGSEADVLAGVDLTRWRPRVVVIESVKPWSHERSDARWRSVLESQGYREACFDGVNLFFAQEHDCAVAEALVPASALDDYETSAMAAMREAVDQLRGYVSKLEEELARHRELEKQVNDYVSILESELQPPSGVAPVIDLTQTREERLPSKIARPPAPARVAIIGTPRTGNTWIRRVLADVLDAEELPTAHPADLDWAGLPDRFVIRLHWQRSRLLERTLREHAVTVISAARHPLDVLLSILTFVQRDPSTREWLAGQGGNEESLQRSGPGDPAFLEWAVSSRARLLLALTPAWWSTPTTHRLRYEDLIADPDTGFATLLDRCELEALSDPGAAVTHNSPARIHATSGGVPVWRASPGAWREMLKADYVDALMDTHREVMVSLGYDPDDRVIAEIAPSSTNGPARGPTDPTN
jgi:FkbM family methyltransferase